jgi:SAM-dependent methyltransferase
VARPSLKCRVPVVFGLLLRQPLDDLGRWLNMERDMVSRLRQCFRYLVAAARCFDPRRAIGSLALPGGTLPEEDLLRRVDEFNLAAERQWQSLAEDPASRAHVSGKPISTIRDTPAILAHVALTLEILDLGVGHVVLDFGAGSCWLSGLLARLGCRAISMDVSRTALSVGRDILLRDPSRSEGADSRFVCYDGRRLPLQDSSVDRVVCFDAFHHVPNQDEVLREIFRVLRVGGRLVLAEPGEGHAGAGHSRFDAEHYGVLENDLRLPEILARARRTGFSDAIAKPYPDPRTITVSADAYLALMAGDHSVFPMHKLQDNLRTSHVIALLKGAPRRDSRSPGELLARIEARSRDGVVGSAGERVSLPLTIENIGDTRWLSQTEPLGGYVTLGAHLLDHGGRLLKRGYFTHPLPHDVHPGQTVELTALFRLPEEPGSYSVVLDMVDERVAWFEQCGSATTSVRATVREWPDSRAPGRLAAEIAVLEPRQRAEALAGGRLPLSLRITNTGDTKWLSGPETERGSVTLGVQLGSPRAADVTVDYFRAELPFDVDPGKAFDWAVEVPLPERPGDYELHLDMVAEQIRWFVHPGGSQTSVEVTIAPGRRPHA